MLCDFQFRMCEFHVLLPRTLFNQYSNHGNTCYHGYKIDRHVTGTQRGPALYFLLDYRKDTMYQEDELIERRRHHVKFCEGWLQHKTHKQVSESNTVIHEHGHK